MKKTPLRSATARTADNSTSESRIDIIMSPPLTSSTKGKKRKSNARATSSSTAEKRWNFRRRGAGFTDSFVRVVLFVSVTISFDWRYLNCGHLFDRRILVDTSSANGYFTKPVLSTASG